MDIEILDADSNLISTLAKEYALEKIKTPALQRDKVWNIQHVKDLLDSIWNRYPIGSIFIWKTIDTENNEDSWILDGQQRLSVMSDILYQTKKNTKIKYEDIYFNLRNENFQIIPSSKNKTLNSTLVRIVDLFKDGRSATEDLNYKQNHFNNQYDNTLNKLIIRIKDAKIVLMQINTELENREHQKIVGNIFVRINRSGKQLTLNEVTTARLLPLIPKLNKVIDGIIDDMETNTNGFYPEKIDNQAKSRIQGWILGLYSLYCTNGENYHSSKTPILLEQEFSATKLEESSRKTKKSIKEAIDRVKISGILDSKVLPDGTFLVVLSYMLDKFKNDFKTEQQNILLNKLIYFSILTNSFLSDHSDIRVVKLIKSINETANLEDAILLVFKSLTENNARIESQWPFSAEKLNISYASLQAKRIKAITLAGSDVKDWKDPLNFLPKPSSINNSVEDHHIFPQQKLKEIGLDDKEYKDNLGNIAFVTKRTNNIHINDRLPEEYLEEIYNNDPKVLWNQFIPNNKSLWDINEYFDFLEARRELWSKKIVEIIDWKV